MGAISGFGGLTLDCFECPGGSRRYYSGRAKNRERDYSEEFGDSRDTRRGRAICRIFSRISLFRPSIR